MPAAHSTGHALSQFRRPLFARAYTTPTSPRLKQALAKAGITSIASGAFWHSDSTPNRRGDKFIRVLRSCRSRGRTRDYPGPGGTAERPEQRIPRRIVERKLPRRVGAQDIKRHCRARAAAASSDLSYHPLAKGLRTAPTISYLAVLLPAPYPRSATPARCPSRGNIGLLLEASGVAVANARGLLPELQDEHLPAAHHQGTEAAGGWLLAGSKGGIKMSSTAGH